MQSILIKLGLERHAPAFENENISPDIVCKMSLYDMRCVGLYDRTEIMKLRTACLPYGASKPFFVESLNGGAPSYDIPKDNLEILLNIGFTINEISLLLGVSESTLYRRMRAYGLKKTIFSEMCEDDLTAVLKKTLEEFPKAGERMLIEILRQKGIHIQRYRLRDILHQHDDVGVKERQLGRLHRRIYHVQCPNHMWHVDTNHKLIRWGFVIFGAIDGFSRLVTALSCLDNNRSDSLLQVFVEATRNYGIPQCVRTDMGLENTRIAEYMQENRGISSIRTGKSTHNQRIERLWRDVYDGVLFHYYQLFGFMEDEHILDVLNPVHIYALHFVYMGKINEKLRIWRDAWATHRIRTVRSSPLRLWTSGFLNNASDTLENPTDFNDDEHAQTNNGYQTPLFVADHPVISEESFLRLSQECPRQWNCPNFGINVYQNAVRILTDNNINVH